jgi:hypothetical protein
MKAHWCEAVHGDVRAPDPACYLTDEEIGL